MGRGIRFVKVGVFLAVAIVIVATAGRAEMAVGILVGVFLITDAAWRSANAYVVRFDGWHRAIAYAAVEALLGIWSLLSYPAQGVVGSDASLLIMNSASHLCVLAARAEAAGRAWTARPLGGMVGGMVMTSLAAGGTASRPCRTVMANVR